MEFEFDFNELDKAVDELADMLTVRWPKENKKFLRQEARFQAFPEWSCTKTHHKNLERKTRAARDNFP